MPKVDDPFSGHFLEGDPRNNLTAGFGCDWPSVPAYRYTIEAPNSTGGWALFRLLPVLLQLRTDLTEHNIGRWTLEQADPVYEFVNWDKLPINTEFDGFEWVLTWKVTVNEITVSNSFTVESPRACNKDVELPNWNFDGINGELGEDAVMRQVVYNQTAPPAALAIADDRDVAA